MSQCTAEVGIAHNLVVRCVKDHGHDIHVKSPDDGWHVGYTMAPSVTPTRLPRVRVFHQWRDKQ